MGSPNKLVDDEVDAYVDAFARHRLSKRLADALGTGMHFQLTALVLLAACADKTCPTCPPPVHAAPTTATVTADAQAPGNVVQTEMRLLTQILEASVRGIGARDVRPIEQMLHELHGAKEATTAAVKNATYKLPKNPAGVAGFIAMDEAFHEHLGALVSASTKNDVPRAAQALGLIMGSCEGCHDAYR